jgi:phosphoserine aminotransferase
LKAFDSSKRLANFSPGPTCLPADVFNAILADLNNHEDWAPGVSPLELSHRSPEFEKIKNDCEVSLRQVYNLPDDFAMIWTHGGGHGMFAAVPLNLITESHKSASFIVNGAWSKKAMNEASKYISVNEISNVDGSTPSIEERKSKWNLENCAFVYLCSNETV